MKICIGLELSLNEFVATYEEPRFQATVAMIKAGSDDNLILKELETLVRGLQLPNLQLRPHWGGYRIYQEHDLVSANRSEIEICYDKTELHLRNVGFGRFELRLFQ